jgi:hypothetical protein
VAALAVGIGVVLIPLALHALPFWASFCVPWLLGVLLGSAAGAVAREERLTALLLIVSAAFAALPPLWPYKSATNWQPPWTAADVLLITFIELFAVGIFTWLFAALLLLLLAAVVALPLNLAAMFTHDKHSNPTPALHQTVNRWFKDRFQIVFGILGIVSEVGSSRSEREMARLKAGHLQRDVSDRR